MTVEERLARELYEATRAIGEKLEGPGIAPWERAEPKRRPLWLALARHVLRRERAAVRRGRGRTIGWACVSADNEFWRCWDSVKADAWSGREDESDVLARVVAVPKPRKGGRRAK